MEKDGEDVHLSASEKPKEEEEDMADRETECECPGGTGDAHNGNEEKPEVDGEAEESLQRKVLGRPVTGENGKPQCQDSGPHHFPGETWLAQLRKVVLRS
ncbi:hypothetical protein NDU88_002222 [Pleurodeles waltl]|uniref:Uncharacterized protein n=1 Tax=Pleurodeles waltl TaxID=8319 RepID=A0AAV7WN15_PLEWA|nr:hypothetical protein NDU88_002222 [Pleurodeles waltl]